MYLSPISKSKNSQLSTQIFQPKAQVVAIFLLSGLDSFSSDRLLGHIVFVLPDYSLVY